jgi:hypothetical protein
VKSLTGCHWGQFEQVRHECHTDQPPQTEAPSTMHGLLARLQKCLATPDLDGMVRKILTMIYWPTFIRRFVILVLDVGFHQPIMLQGFTGCEKTSAVNLLFNMLDLFTEKAGWTLSSGDCHDAIGKDTIDKKSMAPQGAHQIIFFDEPNTSPASCATVNRLVESSSQSGEATTCYIAAINPYNEVSGRRLKAQSDGFHQRKRVRLVGFFNDISPHGSNGSHQSRQLSRRHKRA